MDRSGDFSPVLGDSLGSNGVGSTRELRNATALLGGPEGFVMPSAEEGHDRRGPSQVAHGPSVLVRLAQRPGGAGRREAAECVGRAGVGKPLPRHDLAAPIDLQFLPVQLLGLHFASYLSPPVQDPPLRCAHDPKPVPPGSCPATRLVRAGEQVWLGTGLASGRDRRCSVSQSGGEVEIRLEEVAAPRPLAQPGCFVVKRRGVSPASLELSEA